MSTQLTIRAGTALMVYDDRWQPIAAALGAPTVIRASEVEYDHASGEWFAIYLPTGELIARGPNRAEVIAAEVRWLEANVIEARPML